MLIPCNVIQAGYTYFELFLLNKPSRPARFLRDVGLEDEDESESTDCETERAELHGRCVILVGEVSESRP
jgi:hypothetical protein